jgi:hypothetical protein
MKKCYECETTEDLQEHHVVPRSRGGIKTVTLCYECHMKAHGRDSKGLNHGKLTSEGMLASSSLLGTQLPKTAEVVRKATIKRGNATLERVAPFIIEAIQQGITSNRKIAEYLTEKGIRSPRGGTFNHATVRNLRKQINNQKEEK